MNWEIKFSWLVCDEDINGAFCRICKQTTAESAIQPQEVFGSQNVPELEETSY